MNSVSPQPNTNKPITNKKKLIPGLRSYIKAPDLFPAKAEIAPEQTICCLLFKPVIWDLD